MRWFTNSDQIDRFLEDLRNSDRPLLEVINESHRDALQSLECVMRDLDKEGRKCRGGAFLDTLRVRIDGRKTILDGLYRLNFTRAFYDGITEDDPNSGPYTVDVFTGAMADAQFIAQSLLGFPVYSGEWLDKIVSVEKASFWRTVHYVSHHFMYRFQWYRHQRSNMSRNKAIRELNKRKAAAKI